MAEKTTACEPVWIALEAEPGALTDAEAAHWVSVYSNLLSLLDNGAAVSIGDRAGEALLRLDLREVKERLLFWQGQLDGEAAAS